MVKNLLPFEKIERKVLIKGEAETSKKLGCNPEERKTEEIINYGVVNINKPQGPTKLLLRKFPSGFGLCSKDSWHK